MATHRLLLVILSEAKNPRISFGAPIPSRVTVDFYWLSELLQLSVYFVLFGSTHIIPQLGCTYILQSVQRQTP